MQDIEETTPKVAGTATDPLHRLEHAARDGLRLVKDRARQRDRVGEATYRALELVSDGLVAAARALRQLGEATQPPPRARTSKKTS